MKTLPGRAVCMHTISRSRLKRPSPPRPSQRPSGSRLLVDRVQHRAHRRCGSGAHVRRASRGDRRRLDALAQELRRLRPRRLLRLLHRVRRGQPLVDAAGGAVAQQSLRHLAQHLVDVGAHARIDALQVWLRRRRHGVGDVIEHRRAVADELGRRLHSRARIRVGRAVEDAIALELLLQWRPEVLGARLAPVQGIVHLAQHRHEAGKVVVLVVYRRRLHLVEEPHAAPLVVDERLQARLPSAHALVQPLQSLGVRLGPGEDLVGEALDLLQIVATHLEPRLIRVRDLVRELLRAEHDRVDRVLQELGQLHISFFVTPLALARVRIDVGVGVILRYERQASKLLGRALDRWDAPIRDDLSTQRANVKHAAGRQLARDRVAEGRPVAAVVDQNLMARLPRLQCLVKRLERRAHGLPSLQKRTGVAHDLGELVAGDLTPGAVRMDDGVRRGRSRHDARVPGQR
mmetsp:Transcript_2563/g.6370  ORF Transcript_2563/g.6370 Transcript_2563/m.6370 type:complete len:460 (-) Transcript_2563:64-1443(-)